MTLLAQTTSEMTHALGRPQQQRLRVPATVALHEPLTIDEQLRIGLGQRLAPATRLADAARPDRLAGLKLINALADRVDGHPRRPRRRSDPAAARRSCLPSGPQPPLALIELARQRTELRADHKLVNHTPEIRRHEPPTCWVIYEQALTATGRMVRRTTTPRAAPSQRSGPARASPSASHSLRRAHSRPTRVRPAQTSRPYRPATR